MSPWSHAMRYTPGPRPRRRARRTAILGWIEHQERYADVRLHPRGRVAPGVLVYLDTASASPTQATCGAASAEDTDGAPTPVRWLVFDAEALTHVDATGVDALTELIRSLQREGSRWCSPAARARCAKPSATPGSSVLSATICTRRYGPPCRPRPRRVIGCYRREWGSTSSRTMLIPSDPQRSPRPFGSHLLQPGAYDEAWQQAWK
jgi:hypothetical protein